MMTSASMHKSVCFRGAETLLLVLLFNILFDWHYLLLNFEVHNCMQTCVPLFCAKELSALTEAHTPGTPGSATAIYE